MRKYFSDKNALACPWVESPFFNRLADEQLYNPLTLNEWSLAHQFHNNGYLILDLGLTDEFIDTLKQEVLNKVEVNLIKQDERYEYNDSPRVFEAWKDCPYVLELCKHPKIINILRMLYGREPKAFQTINFLKGSNQPLHSDTIHFHTIPHKWMVGVWVALEDMTLGNGPLRIVPGSHKWDVYEFPDLNLPIPKFGEQFEAYSEYEKFLEELVEVKGGRSKPFLGKKGEVIIWAANLLHGGSPILNPDSTRWSQAIHYYFEGCKYYYSPLFSDKTEGQWALKDINSKDILNHKI
jgi:hypothetical protein